MDVRRAAGSQILLIVALMLAACSAETDDLPLAQGSEPSSLDAIERSTESTLVAIVGDAGELEGNTLEVAALVNARGPDAVLTVGDNEYTTEGRTIAAYQESVGGVYGEWVAAQAFFPVPGDHDYGDQCDDLTEPADLSPYLEYFDLPAGPEDETYYHVRIGDVDVYALDSVGDCHGDGGAKLERQRLWLAAQVPASDARMQIVIMHNPPYSSGVSHGSVRELRWDFATWGVDLVVAGDDHIYERSTHDGVVYLVNGLGGVAAHDLGDPIDGSQVLYGDQFGAVFVMADPNEDVARVSFQAVDGSIIDAITIELGAAGSPVDSPSLTGRSVPAVGATWQWQLQGQLNTSYDVDVYDVDLFDVSAEQIETLHRQGRYVVCYFSAGSHEDWRDDASEFPEAALGKPLGDWEGERWLDVRDPGVLAVLSARMDLAVAKACDGVEPDNVTAANNDTGFDIHAADQLAFNRSLADAAHDRGLSIGLKNNLEQIPALVDHFDFAVNEQCFEYDECDVYAPFVDAGKPVFNAEYATGIVADPGPVCADAATLGLSTVILSVELDDSLRLEC